MGQIFLSTLATILFTLALLLHYCITPSNKNEFLLQSQRRFRWKRLVSLQGFIRNVIFRKNKTEQVHKQFTAHYTCIFVNLDLNSIHLPPWALDAFFTLSATHQPHLSHLLERLEITKHLRSNQHHLLMETIQFKRPVLWCQPLFLLPFAAFLAWLEFSCGSVGLDILKVKQRMSQLL